MSKLYELMNPPSPIEERIAQLETTLADLLCINTQQLHHRILHNEEKARTHLKLTRDLLQHSTETNPQLVEVVNQVSTLRENVASLTDRLTALTGYLDILTANASLEREVLEKLKEKL